MAVNVHSNWVSDHVSVRAKPRPHEATIVATQQKKLSFEGKKICFFLF